MNVDQGSEVNVNPRRFGLTSVKRVVGNKFHMTRSKHGMPKQWGVRAWHRKNGEVNQRDEKITVKPVTDVWDKNDL